jgi:hypothetical protein
MQAATVTVLGLGEAGSAIARDLLAAGTRVRGFDPVQPAPEGVEPAPDAAAAAASGDIVLSVNSASVALDVAETVAPALGRDALFADLNTSAPALKRAIAEVVGAWGARFADVALLRGVPGLGVGTPALVSGTGAESFAATFRGFGMPVTEVGTVAAAVLLLVRDTTAPPDGAADVSVTVAELAAPPCTVDGLRLTALRAAAVTVHPESPTVVAVAEPSFTSTVQSAGGV